MQTEVLDLEAALDAAAVAAPKAKAKDDTPVIRHAATLEKCKRRLEAARLLKDLEAEIGLLDVDLKAAAEPLRLDLCQQTGKLTSIKLNGLLTFIVQNKYGKLAEAGLRARFNGKFESYFTRETDLKVDVKKLTPELVQALVAAGALTVERFCKPTEEFHTAVTLDENVRLLAEAAGIKPVAYFRV